MDDEAPHIVRFYESDGELVEHVSAYLAGGMARGQPIVVICTPEHRTAIHVALRARGYDAEKAAAAGDAVFLDARQTLAALTVGGKPDRGQVRKLIVPHVRRSDGRRVCAFGEMVELLWRDGRTHDALHLEELWNELRSGGHFSLLCAYGSVREAADLHALCAAHDAVDRRSPAKPNATDHLIGELAERKDVERALRRALADVRIAHDERADFLDNAAIAIHSVGSDGILRYANRAELELLGYAEHEYVGRHIAEFHADHAVIRDILAHLARGDALHQRPARLKAKDGSIKHVLITSNVRFNDGAFDCTRCFSHDVTATAGYLERTEKLLRITSALADAVLAEDVYAAVVDATSEVLQASSAALWLVDEGGATATMVRGLGYAAEQMKRFAAAPLSTGNFPGTDAIRDGAPIWLGSKAELVVRYPQLAPHVSASARDYSVACLPLRAGGHTLGSIAFTFDGRPPLDDDARRFVTLIARYTAQALERLRLLDAEQQVRKAAEARAQREALLSRASLTFGESGPDVGATLQVVVDECIREFAEGASVMLVNGDVLALAASADRDAEGSAIFRHLFAAKPPRVGEGMSGQVAATGRGVLLPSLDPKSLVPPGVDPAITPFMPASLVVAPLRTRGKVIGVLTAVRRAMAAFNEDDKRVIEDLAERAAAEIERTRLHDETVTARARAELLYSLADVMNRAARVEETFEASLDALVGVGADRAAILTFDDAGVMRFRAFRDLSDAYRAAVDGHSPWKASDATFAPVIVSDAQRDPQWASYAPLFKAEGVGALAFIPLVAGRKLVGKLMMYWNAPHQLSEHEAGLANAIASHAAAAVARFSLLDELSEGIHFNEMFTGMLGHDLRNPLGAILTAAQLIVRRGEERVAKPAARIITSGERMSRMIDQLLDFTRVRVGGGIPLSTKECDLVPMLRSILDEHVDDGRVLELTQAGDTRGVWDEDRLLQVFSNLVANAVQHGLDRVQVHIDGARDDGVTARVWNGGVIADAVVGKLFEPMAGGSSRRDGSRGLGLGLYITQQIIEAHRGRIEVTSAPDQGTAFTIWLPRTSAA